MAAWWSGIVQNLVASLLWAGPAVLRLLWHHRKLAADLAAVRGELAGLRGARGRLEVPTNVTGDGSTAVDRGRA